MVRKISKSLLSREKQQGKSRFLWKKTINQVRSGKSPSLTGGPGRFRTDWNGERDVLLEVR